MLARRQEGLGAWLQADPCIGLTRTNRGDPWTDLDTLDSGHYYNLEY